MLSVMFVRPPLTDELLKVNSALKPIFFVIGDHYSGGQWRTMKFEVKKTALQNRLTLNL